MQAGSSNALDTGSRHAGMEDLSPLLQNPIRRSSIDTISIEAAFETTPPFSVAAHVGWRRPFQVVSKTLVFETITYNGNFREQLMLKVKVESRTVGQ